MLNNRQNENPRLRLLMTYINKYLVYIVMYYVLRRLRRSSVSVTCTLFNWWGTFFRRIISKYCWFYTNDWQMVVRLTDGCCLVFVCCEVWRFVLFIWDASYIKMDLITYIKKEEPVEYVLDTDDKGKIEEKAISNEIKVTAYT